MPRTMVEFVEVIPCSGSTGKLTDRSEWIYRPVMIHPEHVVTLRWDETVDLVAARLSTSEHVYLDLESCYSATQRLYGTDGIGGTDQT